VILVLDIENQDYKYARLVANELGGVTFNVDIRHWSFDPLHGVIDRLEQDFKSSMSTVIHGWVPGHKGYYNVLTRLAERYGAVFVRNTDLSPKSIASWALRNSLMSEAQALYKTKPSGIGSPRPEIMFVSNFPRHPMWHGLPMSEGLSSRYFWEALNGTSRRLYVMNARNDSVAEIKHLNDIVPKPVFVAIGKEGHKWLNENGIEHMSVIGPVNALKEDRREELESWAEKIRIITEAR
jgi:hypothetical protein